MSQSQAVFSTPGMAAIFSDEAHIAAMLAFEAALALAEADAGVIPHDAARAIAAACRVEDYDVKALFEQAHIAGAHSIPLVASINERVGPDVARFVHWGATSQDVIDTALMLQMRAGLDWLLERLLAIGALCAALAEAHRETPMAGRTLLQHAMPISFGLKAAHWLSAVTHQIEDLRRLRRAGLALQFGGAVGTLSSLAGAGPQVLEALGNTLGLPVPNLPWHTERGRIANIAAALSVTSGVMSKIASDLVLLTQTEVAEVAEGLVEGKGGSSAMPHKRNPVDVTFALAAARLAVGEAAIVLGAMTHEHERAVGAWQAEWVALPNAFVYTASAAARVVTALAGLTVDTDRMRSNLDLTGGLVMTEALAAALAVHLGKPSAYRLVRAASDRARATGQHVRDIAHADTEIRAALSVEEIDGALDPVQHLGSARLFIERAMQRYETASASGTEPSTGP